MILANSAWAQTPPPPPLPPGDGCGDWCDLIAPLLFGTPVAGAVVAAVIVTLLHTVAVRAAVSRWSGGGVNTLSLWLLPVAAGALTMIGCAVAVAVLSYQLRDDYPDFWTLITSDAQQLSVPIVWLVASVGGIFFPPGAVALVGAVTSRR